VFFEDLLLKKGSFNSVGFALFCIFVRNGISVMVLVANNNVDISVVTGFLMPVNLGIHVSPVGLKV
jgi:hypothetical protein